MSAETPRVLKESVWMVDVEQSITGLREAADLLADAGVPADAEVTASSAGAFIHVEARWLYLPDNEEAEGVEAPTPSETVRV